MLKRRDFTFLMGLGLVESVLGQIPTAPKPTKPQDDYMTARYKQYVARYPLASDQFSYEEKTFKYEDKVIDINPDRFCFVNFDLDSQKERFQIISRKGILQLSSLCSHGINSGNNTTYSFANVDNSFMSSLGIYVTGTHYVGNFGPSINLHGISLVNDLVLSRRIVMHGADYCGPEHITKHGFLGRSLGCLALPKQNMIKAFQTLKPGTLIFAKLDKKKK